MPRPMINSRNYEFSFSGLKTAVLYEYRKRSPEQRKSSRYIKVMAREIEEAIVTVLVAKTIRAAQEYGAKSIVLGGGVTANHKLRTDLQVQSRKLKLGLLVPPKNLCTDNGAMVAVTGYYHPEKKVSWKNAAADANLGL